MKRTSKIVFYTLLGAAVLAVAGMGLLWNAMYEPFLQPPEIGRNLPANFHEADLLFKDRLANSYKPGTLESEMIAQLMSEGFDVLPEHQLASFKKTDFPCTLRWLITWESIDARVTKIEGRYDSSCL